MYGHMCAHVCTVMKPLSGMYMRITNISSCALGILVAAVKELQVSVAFDSAGLAGLGSWSLAAISSPGGGPDMGS